MFSRVIPFVVTQIIVIFLPAYLVVETHFSGHVQGSREKISLFTASDGKVIIMARDSKKKVLLVRSE